MEGLVEFFTIAAQWVSGDSIPQIILVYVIYFKSWQRERAKIAFPGFIITHHINR